MEVLFLVWCGEALQETDTFLVSSEEEAREMAKQLLQENWTNDYDYADLCVAYQVVDRRLEFLLEEGEELACGVFIGT